MTIALKIGKEGTEINAFIYLDAVTSYSKTLSGKVTSFPIDAGANISDHFFAENRKFSIRGVISDVDISGVSGRVVLDGESPLNARQQPTAVSISGHTNALSFLPDSIQQFFQRRDAEVLSTSGQQITAPAIETLFEELMGGLYYNQADKRWRNKMVLTTLYEMTGTVFTSAKTDLVITNVSIEEDTDSGDAVVMSFDLEKPRFARLEVADIQHKAVSSKKKEVAGTKNKGTPSTESGDQNSGGPSDLPNQLFPAANSARSAVN